ncbi:hypothetical protein K488DRAFT_85320 [Vararia minispora EC-137]|uniref:Uncharacterized protein n=1 Tax=Vararia minispora EC-137 TaxID=1314806 RepID=A0ACB8QNH2_9AGAM|nr:hypothetical protein K488DRAFT_85320 [Vararia minispora EC-137]
MRFFSVAFSAFLAGCAVLTYAAPVTLGVRQIGNLQCNVARLGVVKSLSDAKSALNTLSSAVGFVFCLQPHLVLALINLFLASSSTTDAAAVQTAQTAVKSAQSAVAGIGISLLTGQTAPANLRDQTAQGITDATTALQNVTSTDPSLQAALSALGTAATNGENVVSECK